MELIDEMLIEGDDSVLRQELVQKRGITGNVSGGINLLGNPWDYKGPMLFITNFIYDPATSPENHCASHRWGDRAVANEGRRSKDAGSRDGETAL